MRQEATPRPSDRLIPWYIVLFFVVQTLGFIWFADLAHDSNPGVVTEEAYDKGLAYNQTIEKARAQESLGFSAQISFADGEASFSLKDKNGAPVTGAAVTAWFYRPAHDGIDFSLPLPEKTSGLYVAPALPPEKGLWEIRIRAETSAGAYQAAQRVVVK